MRFPLSLTLLWSATLAQENREPIIQATFNSHIQDFRFVSGGDAIFSSSFYARGARRSGVGFRGTPALEVRLGGLDDFLVDDIDGGFERYFELPTAARDIRVRFSYNLTLSGGYESNEFSTVIVGIDGKRRHKVMTMFGDSDSTAPVSSGMQSVVFTFGRLSAGLHRLYLSAYNNRKDASNELTRVVFDNVLLTRHTIRPNSNFVTILKTDFSNGQGRWLYADSLFRNAFKSKEYASGKFVRFGGYDRQGALRVDLGGLDNKTVRWISGGWYHNIMLPGKGELVITIVYRLIQAPHYEVDEVSQVLLSVDDELVGAEPGKDYVAQIRGNGEGGGPRMVGYNRVVLYKDGVDAGEHRVAVGGFNRKKSRRNDRTRVLITDVKIVLNLAL